MQKESFDRLYSSKMNFYKETYKNSVRWDGKKSLKNKKIIVYCEQGFGDIIQFSRYFNLLKEKECNVVLHCPKELHSLFKVDMVIDKNDNNLPVHDYHVLSFSLPFLLNNPIVKCPYISIKEKMSLNDNNFKIGIAWEGSEEHSNNFMRCCPLIYFANLKLKNTSFYCIQKDIKDINLLKGCENFQLLSCEKNNFLDTAKLINSMDMIISVDTSVLHLAGAMNKKTIGLLSYFHDSRWDVAKWYSSVDFIIQPKSGDWESVFKNLLNKNIF